MGKVAQKKQTKKGAAAKSDSGRVVLVGTYKGDVSEDAARAINRVLEAA